MNTHKHESKIRALFVCIRVHSWPKCFVALAAAVSLTACGYIGNPMPPTLDMPQTINDVHFAEIGDRILVEFTVAAETTEGLPLKNLRSLELRPALPDCCHRPRAAKHLRAPIRRSQVDRQRSRDSRPRHRTERKDV
jgi:hypothetical protein